jgi:DNA-binding NtrC family response regulator
MLAQRSTLVVSNSDLGEAIRTAVAESSGRRLAGCGYDDFRQQIPWHWPGVVILVAGNDSEWSPLLGVAREAVLRQSPLTLLIVYAEGLGRKAELDRCAPISAMCLPWPSAADEIANIVRAAPDSAGGAAHEELADRLLSLTPSLAPLAERLALAAAHDLTVLLTGETGTGKTYLARLLHEYSPRRNHPFLMVPCGAQAPNLFEACFFGHVKGAYTGAHQSQRGKFAAAGKGTILLDEIDALGLEQQASLLRVIETGEYEQVGGHVTYKSEARIIAASNWDLDAAVEAGRLRQDLYYRINVLSFNLPPLRDRPQDIAPLTRSFAAHFGGRFNKPLAAVTPEAMAILEAYHWPGNIRQLENTIQQAVLACGGSELTARDLPDPVRQHPHSVPPQPAASPLPPARVGGPLGSRAESPPTSSSLLQSRAEYERHLVRKALVECNFNRSSAARLLGVSRVTLHKKIKQYGLGDLS